MSKMYSFKKQIQGGKATGEMAGYCKKKIHPENKCNPLEKNREGISDLVENLESWC